MNQRLWTGEELLACSYKTSVNRGVTIGIYDYTYCKAVSYTHLLRKGENK